MQNFPGHSIVRDRFLLGIFVGVWGLISLAALVTGLDGLTVSWYWACSGLLLQLLFSWSGQTSTAPVPVATAPGLLRLWLRPLAESIVLAAIWSSLDPLAPLLLPLVLLHAMTWAVEQRWRAWQLVVILMLCYGAIVPLLSSSPVLPDPLYWMLLVSLILMPLATQFVLGQQDAAYQDLKEHLSGLGNEIEAKAAFLAGISHELRTPMNGVLGVTRILAEMELSPAARHYVRVLQQSGQALLYIINDVLDYSKIGAGKLRLDRQAFNLGDAIREVLDLLEPVATQNQVTLAYDYEQKAPERFIGDVVRIKQIVFNIVGNGIKYAPRGTVSVRVRVRGLRAPLYEISIVVADDGEGIPPDKLGILFQPYGQTRIEHASEGTGLGLSIARKLANRMWGDIRVSSVIGKGTTFHITLKLEVTYLMQKAAQNPLEARKLPYRRVLLAEDNPVNQMVARVMLTRLGLEVSLVGDGRQAVEAVSAATFDLILLDLEMPVMSGYEAAMTLRKNLLPKGFPLLALTANVDEDDRERALACGFDRVLNKPLEPEYLLQVLAELTCERTPAMRLGSNFNREAAPSSSAEHW
jgi:signal transduction histidine kinase/CheY-like chemotaxis protein